MHGLNIQLNKEDAEPASSSDEKLRKILKLEKNGEEGEAQQDVTLVFKDRKPEEEAKVVQFVILKFPTEQEAIKYYHSNCKDIKILMPKLISQMITSSKEQLEK